jgi:hypothetical protein
MEGWTSRGQQGRTVGVSQCQRVGHHADGFEPRVEASAALQVADPVPTEPGALS